MAAVNVPKVTRRLRKPSRRTNRGTDREIDGPNDPAVDEEEEGALVRTITILRSGRRATALRHQ